MLESEASYRWGQSHCGPSNKNCGWPWPRATVGSMNAGTTVERWGHARRSSETGWLNWDRERVCRSMFIFVPLVLIAAKVQQMAWQIASVLMALCFSFVTRRPFSRWYSRHGRETCQQRVKNSLNVQLALRSTNSIRIHLFVIFTQGCWGPIHKKSEEKS